MNGIQLLIAVIAALGVMARVHQTRLQPGLIIVLLAGAVSFVPGLPRFTLAPEIMLGVVVPPLLYAATLNASFFGFVQHLRSIFGLGIWLVVATLLIVGPVGAWLVPSLGLAGALVLGAILAPADTVTTVTHGRELGLPPRVITILTGESLINDAAALTLFSVTVATVTGTHAFIDNALLLFLYGAVVGLVVGIVVSLPVIWIRFHLREATLETAIGLLVPFTAFLVAEELHASGILAVVMAGFVVSVNSAYDLRLLGSYQTRLQEQQVWAVLNTLLEAFVFAYIGLQFRFVLDDLRAAGRPVLPILLIGLVLLAVVIAVRMAWVLILFAGSPFSRWLWAKRFQRFQRYRPPRSARRGRPRQTLADLQAAVAKISLDWQERALVGWTGMRGIVTLAAAASIPAATSTGGPFPERATIQVIAVVVTLGSLLLQGATLPLLVRWLRLDAAAAARAALTALDHAAAVARGGSPRERARTIPADFDAARTALAAAVRRGDVDDESARAVIHQLDREQAAAEANAAPGPGPPPA